MGNFWIAHFDSSSSSSSSTRPSSPGITKSTGNEGTHSGSGSACSSHLDEVSPNGQIHPITPTLKIFSFAALKKATRKFSPDTLLGEGAFGKVFKGWTERERGNFWIPHFDSSSSSPYSTRPSSLVDSVSSLEVRSTSEKVPASPLRVPPSPSRFSMSRQLSRVGSVHLNMSQINKATRSFAPSMKIGEGGFGTVYKAHLSDGQVVAIKRAKKEHSDSLRTEFSCEVELLAKIDHRNLVKLLGYLDKGNERMIITEYIPNGTLREHLDGQHGRVLDFNQRLQISIDVTHALTYLHLYAERPIIHRDVKSSNILLTESLRAKVGGFRFARLGPMEVDQTHISTKVKGTAGYLDPEYLKTYQLTPKSDVYSFGILLVEILTARRPVEFKRSADERVTVRWAFKKYNGGEASDALDPLLEEVVDGEIVSKMFDLAFRCAAPVVRELFLTDDLNCNCGRHLTSTIIVLFLEIK